MSSHKMHPPNKELRGPLQFSTTGVEKHHLLAADVSVCAMEEFPVATH